MCRPSKEKWMNVIPLADLLTGVPTPVVLLCVCLCLLAPAPARAAMLEHLYDLPGGFNSPSDVAASPSGGACVVDGLNHCLKGFDAQGKLILTIGEKGDGNGQFNYPLGVDVGKSGRIYAADSGNHRVQILDPAGRFIAKIDLPARNGKAADPTDLIANESSKSCYIVDNDNHRILHYDLETLKLKTTYGTPGSKQREFHYPFLIARTREWDLCVVDVLNTRVQVLSPEGFFVGFIGDWGVEKGRFYRPKGIAVDEQDRVYVGDSYLGVVQIFDTSGRFVELANDPVSRKARRFVTPMGLCVDSQRRLYVVEMTLNRVGVFQLVKESAP